MTLCYSVNTQFPLKREHGSGQVVYFQIFYKWHYSVQFSNFSEKPTWFKPITLFLIFYTNDITLFGSKFSLTWQHDSNQVLYFWIFSEMILRCSVLSFLWKHSMVQTKQSISKSPQKWHCAIKFSIFSETTAWFKQSRLFVNFLKTDIMLFS